EDRTVPSNFTAATAEDLIADINAANQQGGSNTITLVAFSIPFDLYVDNTTDGATRLPVIAANDNLTIIGNGNTIEGDGYGAGRPFDVARGAALTLENLTLQGGWAYGSGVSASGGAIYSQGSLTLNGVTVQGNTAASGGAIYSQGSLTLNGVTLQGNAAVGSDGISGGGYTETGG